MKAALIPQKLLSRIQIVSGEDARTIAKTETNIDYLERVNTPALYEMHCAALLDDEGAMRASHIRNFRAELITEYPGPLFGDVLILGETRPPASIEFFSLPDGVYDRIVEKVRLG